MARNEPVGDPVSYLLTPETIATLAVETGISEHSWDTIYRHDQAFGALTKVVVVKVREVE